MSSEEAGDFLAKALDTPEGKLAASMAMTSAIDSRMRAIRQLAAKGIFRPINLLPDGSCTGVYRPEYTDKTRGDYLLDSVAYEQAIKDVIELNERAGGKP